MSLWFVDMNQRVKKPGCVVIGVRVGRHRPCAALLTARRPNPRARSGPCVCLTLPARRLKPRRAAPIAAPACHRRRSAAIARHALTSPASFRTAQRHRARNRAISHLDALAPPARCRAMIEGLLPGQRLARGVSRCLRGLDFAPLFEFVPAPGLRVDVIALGPARRDLDRRVQVEPGRLRLRPQVGRLSRLVRPLLLGRRRRLPRRPPAARRRPDPRRRLGRRDPALARARRRCPAPAAAR